MLVKGIGFGALPIIRQPGLVEAFSPLAELFEKKYLKHYFDENKIAPVLIQNFIERDFDYRIIIIGEEAFCVKITKPAGMVDSRELGESQKFVHTELNPGLLEKLRHFMRITNIVFGHFDFLYDHSGAFIFLECNPNGMWAFYDTDEIISTAFANFFKRKLEQD